MNRRNPVVALYGAFAAIAAASMNAGGLARAAKAMQGFIESPRIRSTRSTPPGWQFPMSIRPGARRGAVARGKRAAIKARHRARHRVATMGKPRRYR